MAHLFFFLSYISFSFYGDPVSNSRGTYDSAKFSTFSIYGNYNIYNEINIGTNSSSLKLNSEYTVNLDVRVVRIFLIKLIGGMTTNADTLIYGFGGKLDLPGFFFIGADANDLIRKRRLNPVNTYAEASIIFYDYTYVNESSTSANKFSLGFDIFLFHRLFLNASYSLMSFRRNLYTSPSVGLGWEF